MQKTPTDKPAVPSPDQIAIEIVRVLRSRKVGYHDLASEIGGILELPTEIANTRVNFDKEESFARNFSVAVQHLENAMLLNRKNRQLKLRVGVTRAFATGTLKIPRVGERAKPKKAMVFPGKLGHMSMSSLLDIWQVANEVLADPSQKNNHQLAAQALELLSDEWGRRSGQTVDGAFRWPTTDAPGGGGVLSLGELESTGMLARLGYHVGKANGQPEQLRRGILDRVFSSNLPPVSEERYMLEWGPRASAARLQKMAVTIAAFARNAKRRKDADFTQAIADWEADLKYLHARYYVGRFNSFVWPSTKG